MIVIKWRGEAQNCLLKTLEEPPEFVTIILIGSNENAFLSTIKSRCMILHFNKIQNDKIKEFVEENYQTRIDSKIMINACQGSIGKAIKLKENKEEYLNIDNLLEDMKKEDIISIMLSANFLYTKERIKTEKTTIRSSEITKVFYRLVGHICIFNWNDEYFNNQNIDKKINR